MLSKWCMLAGDHSRAWLSWNEFKVYCGQTHLHAYMQTHTHIAVNTHTHTRINIHTQWITEDTRSQLGRESKFLRMNILRSGLWVWASV